MLLNCGTLGKVLPGKAGVSIWNSKHGVAGSVLSSRFYLAQSIPQRSGDLPKLYRLKASFSWSVLFLSLCHLRLSWGPFLDSETLNKLVVIWIIIISDYNSWNLGSHWGCPFFQVVPPFFPWRIKLWNMQSHQKGTAQFPDQQHLNVTLLNRLTY